MILSEDVGYRGEEGERERERERERRERGRDKDLVLCLHAFEATRYM